MNTIRSIQKLNKTELDNAVPPESSWHTDYRDTAYIYIGGLPFELSEGDIITIFSQFGEPTFINLVRDKETGKSKGFCFLKYEDQRSTDLAVDNLGGATLMGRVLRVDHTRYKKKDGEDLGDNTMGDIKMDDEDDRQRKRRRTESESEEERPLLPEEIELAKLMRDHDDEDPMKAYLVKQKKEEVEAALKKIKPKDRKHRDSKRRPREHSRDRVRDRERRDGSRDRDERRDRDRRRRGDSKDRDGSRDRDRERRRRGSSRDRDGGRDRDRHRRRREYSTDRDEERDRNRRRRGDSTDRSEERGRERRHRRDRSHDRNRSRSMERDLSPRQ